MIENEDVETPLDEYLLPDEEGESQWPDLRFELMWIEHGGGGLNMRFDDVRNLDLADAMDLLTRMRAQKKREADALKRAHRK